MTRPPKAVIFDMDGVITDTMPYHYRAWHNVLHNEGLRISKYEIYRREGQKGILSVSEIFAQANRTLSIKLGRLILSRKEALFRKLVQPRFIQGSRAFISMLVRNKVRLALVTGTSRQEVKEILPMSLQNQFEVIICGNDVKNGKPHPEPYSKAIRSLGIRGGEGVVIENAPFGILSAKSAGLTCLAIQTSLPRPYLRMADHIFHDVRSLRNYFEAHYGYK